MMADREHMPADLAKFTKTFTAYQSADSSAKHNQLEDTSYQCSSTPETRHSGSDEQPEEKGVGSQEIQHHTATTDKNFANGSHVGKQMSAGMDASLVDPAITSFAQMCLNQAPVQVTGSSDYGNGSWNSGDEQHLVAGHGQQNLIAASLYQQYQQYLARQGGSRPANGQQQQQQQMLPNGGFVPQGSVPIIQNHQQSALLLSNLQALQNQRATSLPALANKLPTSGNMNWAQHNLNMLWAVQKPNMRHNAAGGTGNMLSSANGFTSDSPYLISKFRQHSPFPRHLQHQQIHQKSINDILAENGGIDSSHGLHHLQNPHQDLRLSVGDINLLETVRSSAGSQDPLRALAETNTWLSTLAQTGPLDNKVPHKDDIFLDQLVSNLSSVQMQISPGQSALQMDHYSRKVFVGGLPPDIDEEEIMLAFRQFGQLLVDWPHKAESKSYFPPKGYCFLLFQDEMAVQTLIESCVPDDNKMYWIVSSPTMKDKPVQIRPWNLADSDFVMDGTQPLDPRKTIFVGGVPRPLRALELAVIMNRLYGGVCYAGIDTDPELKYPKGAGRVAFSNQQSYIAAISARFVQLQHADIDKRVEVKPYVLDDQLCDECQGARCAGKFAPYFCANVTCLQYYCDQCWGQIHSRPGRDYHKPLVKEGADRPRSLPFRFC